MVYIYLSIYLSVYLSIYLSIYLSNMHIYTYIHMQFDVHRSIVKNFFWGLKAIWSHLTADVHCLKLRAAEMWISVPVHPGKCAGKCLAMIGPYWVIKLQRWPNLWVQMVFHFWATAIHSHLIWAEIWAEHWCNAVISNVMATLMSLSFTWRWSSGTTVPPASRIGRKARATLLVFLASR